MIERAGRRIVIRREDDPDPRYDLPDYSGILRVPEAERADIWGWRWPDGEGDLESTDRE